MNFIVDRTMPEKMQSTLKKYGTVYKSAKIDIEDEAVSTHPDMQIHFVAQDVAFCAPEVFEFYRDTLPENILLYSGDSVIGRTYPSNCAYNVGRIGNFVICNEKYADKNILEYYIRNNKKIINVKQGYTKCNICPISENSFITEDKGIYNAAKTIDDITPHLINVSDVYLSGFEYGFFGGASGYAENKIFLCGKLPDGDKGDQILNIIKKEEIEYVELSDDKLQDFGSILVF